MKNKGKKLLSVLIAIVLVLGTFSSAMAANDATSGSIDGDSTVTNPVFKFVVPTTADFAFNPFEIGDAGSQITSADLFVINKSSIPVEVSFDYSITDLADGVQVEQDAADVVSGSAIKSLYMSAVPAKVAASNASGSAITTTGSAITWSSEEAVISDAGEEANITYSLSAATYTDADSDGIADESEFTSVDTDTSVAVFRFKGAINPDATWAPADASVSVVYAIKGLTAAAYGAFTEVTDTQNVKSVTSASAPVANVAPAMTDTTKTVAKTGTSVNYAVNLGSGNLAATNITKVEMEYSGTYYALTDAEYDFASNTLTLNKAGTYMTAAFGTAKTYTLRVTFNDTAVSVKPITLVVTN